MALIAEYDFKIDYSREINNQAADFLSRIAPHTAPVETSRMVMTLIRDDYKDVKDYLQLVIKILSLAIRKD